MASRSYPTVEDILAIWSSNHSLDPLIFAYLLSSSQLLHAQQTRYVEEWRNVKISSYTAGRVIDIICYSKTIKNDSDVAVELR